MKITKTIYFSGFKFEEGSEISKNHPAYNDVKAMLENKGGPVAANNEKEGENCEAYKLTIQELREENSALRTVIEELKTALAGTGAGTIGDSGLTREQMIEALRAAGQTVQSNMRDDTILNRYNELIASTSTGAGQ